MNYTRRQWVVGATAAAVAGQQLKALGQAGRAKPNSVFGGVQIGIITYSFRALPGGANETLGYCLECGISAVELMSPVAESYAGAPLPQRARVTPSMTAAERAEIERSLAALGKWRSSAKMDKFKEFRRMYEDAGVSIYCFKLPPTMAMSDAEYEYTWDVAETLGADHITMELPTDDALLQRVAAYAAKRKLAIAFHTHGQGGSSGFDRALDASPYTALNLDVGHYYGVTGESPLPVIEKYHSRISSLHIKDRKGPEFAHENRGPGSGGPNMPFGEGGTPIHEILQLMRSRQYKFPASIEYEYATPEGSDVLSEIRKCVAYCRAALV
jgi:sugar phosphate isomerase/epimerase